MFVVFVGLTLGSHLLILQEQKVHLPKVVYRLEN